MPDLAAFPRGDWVWAMREACREVATADLDYGDPRGSDVLRRVVAGYVRRVRAAAADPDRIVVCTGFAQGLGLSLRVLAARGRCPVFEDPGYGQAGTSSSRIRTAGAAGGLSLCTCRWMPRWASTWRRWRPAGRGRWWSLRRTSRRPAWC